MRFPWPPWRSQSREPVGDFSARLNRAMGDHVVSGSRQAFNGRSTAADSDERSHVRRTPFDDLAQVAFDARDEMLDGPFGHAVVAPAVPILYFGDRDAYSTSPRRILTVGLNPSKAELSPADPFRRFPPAEGLEAPGEAYLSALDTYFKTEPYSRWFSSYESLLNGLDASYYPGEANTALHTDLCSPIATDPTWTRLGSDVKEALTRDGVRLWHDLVRELRPDVILVSVARAHLEKIEFPTSEPFEISRLEEEGRRRPYVTEGRWLDVAGHRALMVFGQASQVPFGLVSNLHKLGIGGRIATHLRNRDESADPVGPEERLHASTGATAGS